jgi:hypothetical protein
VVRTLLDWWDAVELWLTQLSFPVQVLLATLILLPACWAASALVDRGVDRVLAAVAGRRPPAAPAPPEIE